MDPSSPSRRSTFLLAKFSIHLCLFVVFLVFFGIPSWKRCYLKKKENILENVILQDIQENENMLLNENK